jgi:glycosyltransferase involved in cell wall biosynthesis
MIRIAMVCHRYYPDIGGVETYVREISERLVTHGCFDVEVVCTDPSWKYPAHESHNGVKVSRFRSFAPGNAFYFAPQIYFYLKNRDYDIVHAHNYHALPAFFASVAAKGRFIFSPYYHGGSGSNLRNLMLAGYKWMGGLIFEKADKVLCLSRHEMKLIQNTFHVKPSKLALIPSGLNLDEFKDINELKKDSKYILYAGRLESYKGIQFLIEALPMVDGYRLKIIGEGKYEKKLHEQAERLNVSDRIDWLKYVERREYLSFLKSADVFVNLSVLESYGISVAEAVACGTPCIVSTGGALEEFIDGEACTGLSYPVDVKALARAIEGKKRITPREMPDWEDIIAELIQIYSPPTIK